MPPNPLARCTFEHIYFSRPDSFWDGRSVHQVRQRLGEELARESSRGSRCGHPCTRFFDPGGDRLCRASGIPYNDGFIKNRYIGRTFIEPTDSLRKQGVALKFNVINENVRGKRVVMIDDSIVRGNTTGPLVRLLREAGRGKCMCASPARRSPIPASWAWIWAHTELIAHRLTVAEIRDRLRPTRWTIYRWRG